ncbi:MAG: DUF3370 domain-containing protein [Acaryochloridaceae cyanobacterium SU_2_1]|nr:DUF3370 domain-containing protein [Acaryochloridaceae cyanobacterium SU_2_1]
MSFLLSALLLAQSTPIATASELVMPQEVRPLPGQLDQFPVLHSNSPEIVKTAGILVSTLTPEGKNFPQAHLNYPLSGRFDLFAHHVTRQDSNQGIRPLYFGVMLHNPGDHPVKVLVLQANSYLSQADAPFIPLPAFKNNTQGTVFSGPGSRTAGDVLRRERQSGWSTNLIIPPGEQKMLLNLPMPASNSRTTWMRLWTNGPVQAAVMTQHARSPEKWKIQAPLLSDWQAVLENGDLVQPRDQPPSEPTSTAAQFFYGRVAGISKGSEWKATLTDSTDSDALEIPKPGHGISYVINSLDRGTLGTGQIQSAPMLVRYEDTAYRSHGNYGLRYNLDLPLKNTSDQTQIVALSLQTPIKEDQLSQSGLRFLRAPTGPVFFRGTIRLSYTDATGQQQKRYFHLVQNRGQRGKALLSLPLLPKQQQRVNVEFLYPPDSTPPQVLSIQTLSNTTAASK